MNGLAGATSRHGVPPSSRSSSSSSTLSALALPFKLDRPRGQSSAATASSSFVVFSADLPGFVSSYPSFSSMPSRRATIRPYHPCYAPQADDFVDLELAEGVNCVGGGSSWIEPDADIFRKGPTSEGVIAYRDASGVRHGRSLDPFSEEVPSQLEYSEWLYDNYQPIYKEDVASTSFGAPCAVPTALSPGVPYSYFPDSISLGIPVSSSDSSSYHSRCIMQLASAVTFPAPTPAYDPSFEGAEAHVDRNVPRHVTSECQSEDADGTNQTILTEARDPKINIGVGTGYSMGSSMEVKSGLRLARLSIPKSANIESNLVTADISMQVSSEATDDDSLVLDSPCWKGIPASRRMLIRTCEPVSSEHIVMESKDCNDLGQVQIHFPIGPECVTNPYEDRSEVSDTNRKDSSFLKESFASNGAPRTQGKLVDADTPMAGFLENKNQKGTLYSDHCQELISKVIKHCERELQSKDVEALCTWEVGDVTVHRAISLDEFTVLDKGSKVTAQDHTSDSNTHVIDPSMNLSSSRNAAPDNIVDHLEPCAFSGKQSWPGADVQLLIKTMHNLSEMLLCSGFNDASEMKENDFRLLQVVINNLETFAINKKKVAVYS